MENLSSQNLKQFRYGFYKLEKKFAKLKIYIFSSFTLGVLGAREFC